MNMKKMIGSLLLAASMAAALTGCGGASNDAITVISREDGSGTRGAFIELFGIETKDSSGEKVDNTINTADQTNSTGVMLTSVAQNASAIGYVSLGSLNDTVKALKIDGADATAENVENGSYKVSRPFNIATKDTISEVSQDFINFILSSDGQAVISKEGYIPVSDAAYNGDQPSGKIVVAGSSSVSPVMEKLIESYKAVNPNAEIELQTSDSTTGMNSTMEGICDIGMASRELKDSETSGGLTATVIAQDGIAVIANTENKVTELSSDQVKGIYTGEITSWSEIK